MGRLVTKLKRTNPTPTTIVPARMILREPTLSTRNPTMGPAILPSARAKLKMKFPTPNYRGLATAPGLIVVVADFRYINAFPVLNDGSDLDRMYKENAERILLQSVAASTMSAHLAAAALGYGVWWVTAIGQIQAQSALKPLFDVPDDLSVIDIMVFGKPLKAPYKRWKKDLDQIRSWGTYDRDAYMTQEAIDTWIKEERHKVMYRDESKVD